MEYSIGNLRLRQIRSLNHIDQSGFFDENIERSRDHEKPFKNDKLWLTTVTNPVSTLSISPCKLLLNLYSVNMFYF
jgi:hypothetical protein